MQDDCLERSRRQAWARYFAARADAEQIAWWAAEIAEWLDALVDDIPPAATELMDLCTERVGLRDLITTRRYVAAQIAAPDWRGPRQIGAA